MTPEELAARAAALFTDRAGSPPAGIWWAPGRVNLIGEHTDYNDGFVLPFAIDRGTVAAARRRDDGVLRCWSAQEGGSDDVTIDALASDGLDGWSAYPKGVAWVLRERGVRLGGADLVFDSTLPEGSGLSSSAALECAAALALGELHDAGLEPAEVARVAQRAETEVVGVPSGIMDQVASMLGHERHALFLDTRTLETQPIPLDVAAAGLELVVVDTRVPRRLAEGAYGERRASCEEAARVLGVPALRDATPELVEESRERLGDVGHRRARHVVTENARVLAAVEALRAGDFDRLGPLLDASHASLRDDYEVSAPGLDLAVDASRAAGAIGARMTGAGFGGSALALVPTGLVEEVERQVVAAFADAGLDEPEVFRVAPAAGARRLL